MQGMGYLIAHWAMCIQKGMCQFDDPPPWLDTGMPDEVRATDFQQRAAPLYFQQRHSGLLPPGKGLPAARFSLACRGEQGPQASHSVAEQVDRIPERMHTGGYLSHHQYVQLRVLWAGGGGLGKSIENGLLLNWPGGYAFNVEALRLLLNRTKYATESTLTWRCDSDDDDDKPKTVDDLLDDTPRGRYLLQWLADLPDNCNTCDRHYFGLCDLLQMVNEHIADEVWDPYVISELDAEAKQMKNYPQVKLTYKPPKTTDMNGVTEYKSGRITIECLSNNHPPPGSPTDSSSFER
jgi:hypothetical protein